MSFTYSSDQFQRDWRYAISKPFVSPSGSAFAYHPTTGKQSWGDERQCLEFDGTPSTAAVSSSGKYLAVAVGAEVHVCDLQTRERRVLKGHVSRVDVVAFRPGGEGKVTLVSCAMNHAGGSVPAEPSIVFWDLDVAGGGTGPAKEEIAHVTRHAVRAVVERLGDRIESLHLGADEQEVLAGAFGPAIEAALVRESVKSNKKIHGRLQAGCQSNVFSPSGRYMFYLPGGEAGVEW